MNEVVFSPADFVASLNQTLEFAYPGVSIIGELANFRVSKNKWVYFDLKDGYASVKFFGTVYQLPGPLEDGLMLKVRGTPRMHPQFGFSINVQTMQPVGEGSLKKAAALLEAKLAAEGLFDPERKRALPFPPRRIGLITSGESAAYADFIKIINTRWSGMKIIHADIQVQGESSVGQIVRAIEYFNTHAEPVDVLVAVRGGGSADDLAAFSTEQVTRSVAGSRIPTLVAIGHEIDISLAELAADKRASTPSNAAELLVPDKRHVAELLSSARQELSKRLSDLCSSGHLRVKQSGLELDKLINDILVKAQNRASGQKTLLEALGPQATLERGYAIVRLDGRTLRSASQAKKGDNLDIRLAKGNLEAEVKL